MQRLPCQNRGSKQDEDFAHVLRRDTHIPSNETMHLCLSGNNKIARGRRQTTVLATLNENLNLEKTSQKDLNTLRHIAENPPRWPSLIAEMRKTAEAAGSDNAANGGPLVVKSTI
ncbi:hypothetical protein ElyMa_002406900 [Elysia marginata]|uniref:Uncharacterized protein n=1 Tax=Elysia marginata TaxID=1093978 RepID=A0AAV4GER8_9GAST|nr:hypothetical protein ElyMa_002406900 [Elysia marginata]